MARISSFELGPIRPPSEAYSLLIRVTRNCPWNRCRFCRTYKGCKFELRSVDEVKQDITVAKAIREEIMGLAQRSGYSSRFKEAAAMVYSGAFGDSQRNVALWLYAGGTSAFLQDANSLIMPTDKLVEIIRFLKETFPNIDRITTYGRSKTAAKKKPEELTALREAGLSRIHIGLESGYDPLLQYMDKGVTAAEHIAGGRGVVASGISLCEYVILGLGGKKLWREHATETARVLSEINPDFIRIRTLNITQDMPLHEEVEKGNFVRATDEEIIEEEKLLIKSLQCSSNFVSDHITNLLPELEGKLPEDRDKLLSVIARFQALTQEERTNFIVGRRAGLYTQLDDLDDSRRHGTVEEMVQRLSKDGNDINQALFMVMERFI